MTKKKWLGLTQTIKNSIINGNIKVIKGINKLFDKASLKVEKHMWDCGNEIFILTI